MDYGEVDGPSVPGSLTDYKQNRAEPSCIHMTIEDISTTRSCTLLYLHVSMPLRISLAVSEAI